MRVSRTGCLTMPGYFYQSGPEIWRTARPKRRAIYMKSMSVSGSESQCDGRQTGRLERRDAVNLCLARPAAAPGPLIPVPPSIVKSGGGAIPGTGSSRGTRLFTNSRCRAESLGLFAPRAFCRAAGDRPGRADGKHGAPRRIQYHVFIYAIRFPF